MQLLCIGYILPGGVGIPVCSTDIYVHTLTFDLGGEVGGVTSDKELQLLMEVTAREVDVPRSDSCRAERERERDRVRHTSRPIHLWLPSAGIT